MRPLLWPNLLVLVPTVRVLAAPTEPSSLRVDALSMRSERSWLWGWAWGAESTVSVVDRSPMLSFASRPAAFGAEINDPILGYVIPLSSFTAKCPTNTSSPNANALSLPPNYGLPEPPDPSETWIALVQRGGCEFVNKVREAQRLGARAVVVGGENPALTGHPDALVNMYSLEDAADVKIPSTYITYLDYLHLSTLIAASNTSHSGLRTLSLLITAEYGAWEWYSPIITFIVILLLPSLLTFITLLIHRIRAARAAQRERAPEDIVHNLPWRVWTGSGWEKHESTEDPYAEPAPPSASDEQQQPQSPSTASEPEPTSVPEPDKDDVDASATPSTSQPAAPLAWFDTQLECAICLSEFEKGDKVRVLPLDEWLIQRKKLCPVCKADVTQPLGAPAEEAPAARATSPDNATERTPLLESDQ
ncbi:hypothetical protein C8J57DRAFT_1294697 [Mycena rebaudengoi]|nr:hypothetical protein C8J57DRAFT_1294697 [Mycena rebaudengoi]